MSSRPTVRRRSAFASAPASAPATAAATAFAFAFVFAFAPSKPLAAQASTVVPGVCTALPGNAALSLPLRWSHGTMQVFVDPQLLPPSLTGQTISGLWLRRPTLPGDVAYAPIQRTLTVRGGFQASSAAMMLGTVTQNRPANVAVLFGPAPVTSFAAPAPGPATALGADLLHVVFTQPLPVAAGTLFLELETGDAPLQVSSEHWVDGFWHGNGGDGGYAAAVGDGSCTTRGEPTRLAWSAGVAAGTATAGSTVSLEVSGAPPTAAGAQGFVLVWAGLDPQARGPGAGFLGYGASLAVIDPAFGGCHQWAPFDVAWLGPTDANGRFATALAIPGSAAAGTRLALQAAWLDASRPALPLSFSNGLAVVVGPVGVGPHCSTMFFPAGSTASPWPPFRGQMPVLRLDH
jgi:hypothetical protein